MDSSTRTLVVIASLLAVIATTGAQPSISDKVVKFGKDHLDKKVGAGECTDLADAALKQAGAKPRSAFKDSPNEGDYVWGDLVYALEIKDGAPKETKVPKMSIQPGDVIQLRDTTFKGKNLRGFENYDVNYPHHTAVVLAVKKEEGVITVLEQNNNGKKVVMENPYRLTDLRSGWLRIYRPVPK
jgi:hypothetical protein